MRRILAIHVSTLILMSVYREHIPKMNVTEKTLQKILNRKNKGYAFMSYPRDGFSTAQEYREHHERELQRDNTQLSIIQFSCKYDVYMY